MCLGSNNFSRSSVSNVRDSLESVDINSVWDFDREVSGFDFLGGGRRKEDTG